MLLCVLRSKEGQSKVRVAHQSHTKGTPSPEPVALLTSDTYHDSTIRQHSTGKRYGSFIASMQVGQDRFH